MTDPLPAPSLRDRSRTVRIVRRVVVLLIGIPVVLAGVILLVAPGPGTPILIAGLAILAIEFQWAQNQMDRLKKAARRVLGRAEEDTDA